MTIEFNESSWTKYHYGTLSIESENENTRHAFTLIENYDNIFDHTEFEVVWPDGPPHNWRNLEKFIVEEFNQPEL